MPLEICLLRKISDIDGVIRLLDFYEMPETFVLILERPPRSKDLFDFINDHGFLDESLSRDFLRQVVDTILGKKNILKLFYLYTERNILEFLRKLVKQFMDLLLSEFKIAFINESLSRDFLRQFVNTILGNSNIFILGQTQWVKGYQY